MERRRQREDRFAVLYRRYPPRGERPAVPDPVHQVDQRHGRIAGPDEVGVQRVHWPVFWHGPPGGDERLTGHLAAEHSLPAFILRAPAAENVELDLLQIKQFHDGVQGLAHRRAPPVIRDLPWTRVPGAGAITVLVISVLIVPEAPYLSTRPARNRDGFLACLLPGDLASDQDKNSRSRALVIPTYSSRCSSAIASAVVA